MLAIKRTSAYKRRCNYPGCAETQRLHRFSIQNRQNVLVQLKVYVPPDVMVCVNHTDFDQWLNVSSAIQTVSTDFTKRHIEDMFNLMTTSFSSTEFRNLA